MKKSFLLCATAVLLVACGGGGGGGVAATPDGTKINLDLSPKGHVAGKTDNGYIEGKTIPICSTAHGWMTVNN